MKNMENTKTLLILTNNSDFAETMVALAKPELSLQPLLISSENEIQNTSAELLLTTEAINEPLNFPVIMVNLPVRLPLLLTKIHKVLENSAYNNTLAINDKLHILLQQKTIVYLPSTETIDLTDKEIQLLQAIIQAGNDGVLREALLQSVWGITSELDTHTLETHIYRLRKKIRDAFDIEIIKASEGGYKLAT